MQIIERRKPKPDQARMKGCIVGDQMSEQPQRQESVGNNIEEHETAFSHYKAIEPIHCNS
jgi:hypothetical protein